MPVGEWDGMKERKYMCVEEEEALTRSDTESYSLQKYRLRSCNSPPATIYCTAGSRTWPTEKSIELEEPEETEPKSCEKANTGLYVPPFRNRVSWSTAVGTKVQKKNYIGTEEEKTTQ